MNLRLLVAAIASVAPAAVLAQSINFGDDASKWSNDGECDDRRFRGAGTAMTLAMMRLTAKPALTRVN